MPPTSISALKSQGPLPHPTPELWPNINPYQQRWLLDEIGADNFEKLLQFPTATERKNELADMTAARVEMLKAEEGGDKGELLGAMQRLGDRLKEAGRVGEAKGVYEEVLGLYAGLDGDPEDDLRRNYGLAHVNFCMGNYIEAEKLYLQALPYLKAEPLGVDSPQYLGAWRAIVEAVARQGGRWDDVRRLLDEGVELVRGMRGGEWWRFEGEEMEAMEEVRGVAEGLEKVEREGKVAEVGGGSGCVKL